MEVYGRIVGDQNVVSSTQGTRSKRKMKNSGRQCIPVSLVWLIVECGVGIAVLVGCFVHKKGTENQIAEKLGAGFSRVPFAIIVGITTYDYVWENYLSLEGCFCSGIENFPLSAASKVASSVPMPDITKKETGFSEAKAFKHVKALSQIPSPPFSSDQSPLIQGDKVTGTSGHYEKMLSSVAPDKHTCTLGNSKNWMVLSISGDKPTPRSYHATVVIHNKMIVVGGEFGSGLLDDVQVLNFDRFSWTMASSKLYLSPSSLPLKLPACKGHCLVLLSMVLTTYCQHADMFICILSK
ncbi:hypothetical protein GLYMA_03G112050v4 [Glycine max]|nr:hypothetical protein GLYMA_03G112050v4 [Glycine max]